MDVDVQHQILATATELFELAHMETATRRQYDHAIEHVLRDAMERRPDLSVELLYFAIGRAVGRIEGRAEGDVGEERGK